jgi:hypothetical protein
MNLRQRNLTIDDAVHKQTSKLQHTSSSSLVTNNANRSGIFQCIEFSFTSFEHLANEIIYEVFEYLDAYHIYQSFFNLNTRFQNLLLHVNVPIQFDISNLSKSTFQHYYTDFIRPIQHRMKILHLSDPITIEYIFPVEENISIYSQLQKLFLDHIESKYLEDLLHRLAVLPSLSSLTMYFGSGVNKTNIYNRLFQLPMLKYCKLSFEEIFPFPSLPICINPSSLIEHLIIKDNYYLNEIDSLISHVPHLRRLSITSKYAYMLVAILLNDLTELVFTLVRLVSDDLDQFIKKRSDEIKVLHFWTVNEKHYPYIETSRQLISSYLPHVKIFHWNNAKEIICGHSFEIYKSIFGNRHGFFQETQQWFFTHKSMSEENLHQIFCSFAFHR